MKKSDLAWVAGFLEGEGSFCCYPRCTGANGGRGYYQLSITAAQANREPLDTLVKILGGSVCGPYQKLNRKPYWLWGLSSVPSRLVMKKLLPFMSVRRQNQINLALETDAEKVTPK